MNCKKTYQEQLEKIKKRYKGNFIRESKRAKLKGYLCGNFDPLQHCGDIEAINKSLGVRSGGPMRPAYNRSAYELRIAYSGANKYECKFHWALWWGISNTKFSDLYLGYILLRRVGSLAQYSTILGHGGFMGDGIMPALHLAIINEISCQEGRYEGVDWLMYAGFHDGGKGLTLWKKKAGFDPVIFFQR